MKSSPIAIIGGSGLCQLPGLEAVEEVKVETPFGDPSDVIFRGNLAGRELLFLPRHGRNHSLLPTEIPHRANLWALRHLGARFLFCVAAVGSLKQELAPRTLVVIDQFYDRTSTRIQHTFFGRGIVAHVGFGEPLSGSLRRILVDVAQEQGVAHQDGGTYVCMDGPAFSTRAESRLNCEHGFDVIGMTNLPEAKLAREAEMACATLAFVTDYDAWKEEHVTAAAVMEHTAANAAAAKKIIAAAVTKVPEQATWPEHQALLPAVMTPRAHWNSTTAQELLPILGDGTRFR